MDQNIKSVYIRVVRLWESFVLMIILTFKKVNVSFKKFSV